MDERILACVATGAASLPELRILGAFALYGSTGKPGKKADRMAISEVMAQLEAGVDLVEDWPEKFLAALNRQRVPVANDGVVQLLAEAFPRLGKLGKLMPDGVWRQRVEEAIDSYCGDSLSSSAPIVGRNAVLRTGPMTLKQIAEQLGRRVEIVARAVDLQGGAIRGTRVTAQGRRRRVVGRDDLTPLALLLQEPIALKGAARLLALPASRVRMIVRSGLLTQTDGRLCRSQILGLAAHPLETAQLGAEAPCGHLPVRRALRDWVRVGDTVAVLRALRSGELHVWVKAETCPIGEWLVAAADVSAWAAQQRTKDSAVMTLTQAAAVLSLKHDVARDLVMAGLLRATAGALGGRRRWCVWPSDLAAFKVRYVALAELTTKAKVRARDGFKWAQSKGLKVVTGPRVDGSRQYFVDQATS